MPVKYYLEKLLKQTNYNLDASTIITALDTWNIKLSSKQAALGFVNGLMVYLNQNHNYNFNCFVIDRDYKKPPPLTDDELELIKHAVKTFNHDKLTLIVDLALNYGCNLKAMTDIDFNNPTITFTDATRYHLMKMENTYLSIGLIKSIFHSFKQFLKPQNPDLAQRLCVNLLRHTYNAKLKALKKQPKVLTTPARKYIYTPYEKSWAVTHEPTVWMYLMKDYGIY